MHLLYPLEFQNCLEVRLDNKNLGPNHQDLWCDIYELKDLNQLDQMNLLIGLGDFFTFMPVSSSTPNGKIKPEFLKQEIKESVTFFGGSFFPFHPGHLSCLDLCPEKNIVVVPDCNPLKELPEKMNPFLDFVELSKTLKETSYSLYPGFFGRNKPNPTSHWLPNVKIPEINFLMGDDSFMNLFKWTEPEKFIKALTKLYVVPRLFLVHEYSEQIKRVKDLNPKIRIIILPDHPYKNISSTKLRTK